MVYSPVFPGGLLPGFAAWITLRIFYVGLLREDHLYAEDVEENAKCLSDSKLIMLFRELFFLCSV